MLPPATAVTTSRCHALTTAGSPRRRNRDARAREHLFAQLRSKQRRPGFSDGPVHVEARQRFARNLWAKRMRLGLSQEALGKACDLHRTEVSLLERAGRDPRLSTIVRLARGLKIAPAELLDGVR